MQEMVIYGVSFDMVGKQPIVLLKTADSNKFLPIWIGHPEAAAILMKLQGATTPRPMTHDLLVDMLGELDVRCTQVAVTELRDNTFFASITLAVNGRELEIDSRPSDALALAVRSGAPIFAAEEVIAESAIEFEHEVEDTEEVVDKFKEFLDQVTPEDFAGGELPAAPRVRRRRAPARQRRSTPRDRARRSRSRRPRRPAAAGSSRSGPGSRWPRARQLVARPRASGRRARSRGSRAARKTSSASSCARSVSSSPSSAGQTNSVRPIS